ncbi:AraC family transcriptional regulator [Marinoscillum furvescens]|uniref:AraC-like DNA-binding protein n=1 Tax=Marinoscillum furvescens DSM 4134 TaxID=1122208 RepID=A0A3D9L483_MARFU|nr:AraC family transcriptional regulator [Marinoscillum furvescens]RED98381.1 AraC-like DNA-binding protein [Marinoscillum furvescens DSM 4134]
MKKFKRELTPLVDYSCFILQNHFDAKFDYPVHLHPEYEINVVLNTNGTRIIGDNQEHFEQSDIALIGPNLLHAWRGSEEKGVRVITIQFSNELFEFNLLKTEGMWAISKLLDDSSSGVIFDKKDIPPLTGKIMELIDLEGFDAFIAFLQLLNFMASLQYRKALLHFNHRQTEMNEIDFRIEKVCRYIDDHFHENISMHEIAEKFNFSPSSFSHFFKKYTYRSFTQYLLDLRIKRACQLLIESDTPVGVVYGLSGFTNASNFNRIFKKTKNVTPLQYRKKFGLKLN